MSLFITILAWGGAVLAALRIGFVLFWPRSSAELSIIRLAEAYGQNPIGNAILRAMLLIGVCAAWLVSYYIQ